MTRALQERPTEPAAMKLVLDHVGIAVGGPDRRRWRSIRDALGLEVESAEEVAIQQVRAHFLPAGGPKLELLEATADGFAGGTFVAKRGPGLHHIALPCRRHPRRARAN